jgi:hypothetical protein
VLSKKNLGLEGVQACPTRLKACTRGLSRRLVHPSSGNEEGLAKADPFADPSPFPRFVPLREIHSLFVLFAPFLRLFLALHLR